MEPTEAQYLVLNALETLGFLQETTYDEATGRWYINTFSNVLPVAMIVRNGEVVPVWWTLEL
ncbi:MAG TPA: hypothetical protein V6D18_13160 [Thermosynechococcaceae cyanobacterium]